MDIYFTLRALIQNYSYLTLKLFQFWPQGAFSSILHLFSISLHSSPTVCYRLLLYFPYTSSKLVISPGSLCAFIEEWYEEMKTLWYVDYSLPNSEVLLAFGIASIFYFSHFNKDVVISHYGFNLLNLVEKSYD